MLILAIVFSLIAAFCNALGSLFQRRASVDAPRRSLFTVKLGKQMLQHKFWLIGLLLQIIASLFEAFALANGQLSFVEPIMTVDLLFLFVMMHYYYRISLGIREWTGGGFIVVGLAGFLIAANPTGGMPQTFDAFSWIVAGGTVTLVIFACIFAGRFVPKLFRAGILGVATGASYALTEALTKSVMSIYQQGPLVVFTGWQLYCLLLVGIGSMILAQNAYSSGPLSTSQPAIMIVASIGAIFLGVFLFHDHINLTFWPLVFESLSAVLLFIGILFLAGSKSIAQNEKVSGNIGYQK